MYFKVLTALLPLVTAAAGYIVPADLPDGLYLVPLNESNPSPQRVDLATVPKARLARSVKFAKQLAKRLEWAGTGHTFPNHGDYNACTGAWRDFWANGNSVPGHFLFLCTVGEAVLAGCNYTREYLPYLYPHKYLSTLPTSPTRTRTRSSANIEDNTYRCSR